MTAREERSGRLQGCWNDEGRGTRRPAKISSRAFAGTRGVAVWSAGLIRDFLASSAIWWWISSIIVGAWIFAVAYLLL
jgi:hypothetical protein